MRSRFEFNGISWVIKTVLCWKVFVTGRELWKEQPLCLILRWVHSWEEKELQVKWEHLKWNHWQKVQINSAMHVFVVTFQKKTSCAKIYFFTCRYVFQWKLLSSLLLQITKASRRSLNAGLAYSEHHQIRVSQQDYKLFRSLFLLMISFFIMWSPIIVIIFLILVQNFKKDLNILPSVFFWIALFTFANSAVNPILYNVAYFRRKCQEILLCCTGNPERHGAGTETTVRRTNREQPQLSFITR